MMMFSAENICGISIELDSESNPSISDLYAGAVNTLNKLQYKSQCKTAPAKDSGKDKLSETVKYLNRIGITLNDLDKLSVIHVSGTKGKGSTCALTESILRSFGMKTGFYSSPHLISVTERVRINGQPLSKQKFTKNFWEIYNKLIEYRDNDFDMPGYFQFLTIFSFHIFLVEKVDIAVIEVGIGGQNDCTNILRNTKTIGITSLGLDHVKQLGTTLDKIAWHKAGIIKENSSVFTVRQPEQCLEVLRERAAQNNASLEIIEDLMEMQWEKVLKLQIENKVQYLNAALAIQLANHWIRNNRSDIEDFPNLKCLIKYENKIYKGLENCFWPGRCQLVVYKNIRIYLDGAHTIDSIDVCSDWFQEQTTASENPKILIFNATGVRDSLCLLEVLKKKLKFTKALFAPNIPYFDSKHTNPDITTFVPNAEQIERTQLHSEFWTDGSCFPCILDALSFIVTEYGSCEWIEVLVTGSIHLIGSTILAIERHNQFQDTISN